MRREDALIASTDVSSLETLIGKAPILDEPELTRALAAADKGGEAGAQRREPRQRRHVPLLRIQLRRAS